MRERWYTAGSHECIRQQSKVYLGEILTPIPKLPPNCSQDGYVHVMLRQQPPIPGQPEGMVKIELSVIDTGKVRMKFGSRVSAR